MVVDEDGSPQSAAFVQLPPCKAADSTFLALIDEHGRPVTESWKENRRARLLDVFDAVRPDVVMVEMFPFGRRALEFEILPLLERAQAAVPRPAHRASKPFRAEDGCGARRRDPWDVWEKRSGS